jgi:hypothetical protein
MAEESIARRMDLEAGDPHFARLATRLGFAPRSTGTPADPPVAASV